APWRVVALAGSGAGLAGAGLPPVGAALALKIHDVGTFPARVVRVVGGGAAVQFTGLAEADRDRLIHAIYGSGRTNAVQAVVGGRRAGRPPAGGVQEQWS